MPEEQILNSGFWIDGNTEFPASFFPVKFYLNLIHHCNFLHIFKVNIIFAATKKSGYDKRKMDFDGNINIISNPDNVIKVNFEI